MTYEEALYQISNYGLDDEESPEELREAAKVFREALEKQIPKKPNVKVFSDEDEETGEKWKPKYYVCAVCGDVIALRSYTHCHCGQSIDWSENDG